MGVAAALAIGSIAAGVGSSIAQGRAAKRQAEAAEERSEFARFLSGEFLGEALGDISAFRDAALGFISGADGLFRRTPPPETFFDTAADIERRGFDFQTGLKRENLDFILGDTEGDIRSAQNQFAQIASGDFSSIQSAVTSRLLGVQANNRASPVGTRFNIAARDELAFRQTGLSQALGITDFFAREGTVDPPNPVATTFALAEFANREDAQELQFHENQLDRRLAVEQAALGGTLESRATALGVATEQGLAGFGAAAGAGSAALGSSLAGVGQGLSSLSAYIQQRQALEVQRANVAEFNRLNGTNFQATGQAPNGGFFGNLFAGGAN